MDPKLQQHCLRIAAAASALSLRDHNPSYEDNLLGEIADAVCHYNSLPDDLDIGVPRIIQVACDESTAVVSDKTASLRLNVVAIANAKDQGAPEIDLGDWQWWLNLDPVAEIVEPAMSTSEPHYQSTIVRAVSSPNAVLRVHPIEDLAKTASVPVVDETLHDPPCDRCKLRELACTRTANEACEHCFKSKSRCSFVPGRGRWGPRTQAGDTTETETAPAASSTAPAAPFSISHPVVAIPTRKQKRKATSEPDILEKAPPPRKARLTGPSSILPSTGAPSTALPADDEPEVSTLTAPSLSTEQQTLPSAVNEVAVRTAVEPRLLSIATFISYIPDIHSSLSAVRDSVRYSASSIETCAAMLVSTLRTVENKLSQALDLVAEIQRKLPPTNPSSQSANDGQPQGSTSNALTPAAPLPNPDRSVQFVLPAPPRTTPSPRAAATGSARAKPKRRSTARPVSRGGSSQVSK